MLPLARAEIEGRSPSFLEHLFEGKLKNRREATVGDDLVRLVLLGGFPEAIRRDNERRRQDWSRSYLTSILTRDLRKIANVEKLTELPKFVRLLAEHSGQLVNYSQFGASINVSHKTGQRYVALLEQVFLIATVQPWFTNALKRIVKTPRLHFLNSGLLASVRGLTFDRVKADRRPFGALLESFMFSEVLKFITASDLRLTPHHFRDRDMREGDIVLERDDGAIVGIEVKASATVKAEDFRGLRALAEACGDRFAFSVVLYDGTDVVPFGGRLAAAPLTCLWG
jgi:predicted AAA+ superfamily ATPase